MWNLTKLTLQRIREFMKKNIVSLILSITAFFGAVCVDIPAIPVAGTQSVKWFEDIAANGYVRVVDSSGTALSEMSSTGNFLLEVDDAWVGAGSGATDPRITFDATDGEVTQLVQSGECIFDGAVTSPNITCGHSANVNTATSGGTIAGGGSAANPNTVSGDYTFVGGGYGNDALDECDTIGGGEGNTADGPCATIAGGDRNTASGTDSAVGGGFLNDAEGGGAAIGGGFNNDIEADSSSIGGGQNNVIRVAATFSAISGGQNQEILATYGFIGGGADNESSGDYAAVGGGSLNKATNFGDFVGGGWENLASGGIATVSGGTGNYATSNGSSITGGSGNAASAQYATANGGQSNTASGSWSTVTGGKNDQATASYATVSGGSFNVASANYGAIPGGASNAVDGQYGFAAGRRAKANSDGCFVWGDSTNSDVTCTNANRTIFRSAGGYYIYTNAALGTGMYLAAGGSAWNAVSDRESKKDFANVDGDELLSRISDMPTIETWYYKDQEGEILHVGAMADEFNGLIDGLGGEGADKINQGDAIGVNLAAIQALIRRVDDLEKGKAVTETQAYQVLVTQPHVVVSVSVLVGSVIIAAAVLLKRR